MSDGGGAGLKVDPFVHVEVDRDDKSEGKPRQRRLDAIAFPSSLGESPEQMLVRDRA